jgi:MFS family permease
MTHEPDSKYAALRLVVTLALMTIGSSGMYVVAVVLPTVQADFGVARADASLPYTLTMIGFGIGGLQMRRLADRFGVMLPLMIGAGGLGLGFAAAGLAPNIWVFASAQGGLIGLLGSSATFAPLVTDTSLWFVRRRGIAVAICASGNYFGGAIWPPIVQRFVEAFGWRSTYLGLALFCALGMTGLALLMRPRPPIAAMAATGRGLAARFGTPVRARPARCARAALRRRSGLLRRDVDAAGAHRRLLR